MANQIKAIPIGKSIPWDEFKLQLDDFELGFFQSSVNTARQFGQLQEIRIGPLRYAVGAKVVIRLE